VIIASGLCFFRIRHQSIGSYLRAMKSVSGVIACMLWGLAFSLEMSSHCDEGSTLCDGDDDSEDFALLALRARKTATEEKPRIEHSSNFGSAPDEINISGFCHNKTRVNGLWEFGGRTGEGRPFFMHSKNGDYKYKKYLYYDREPNGEVNGTDNQIGRWRFVQFPEGDAFPARQKEAFTSGMKSPRGIAWLYQSTNADLMNRKQIPNKYPGNPGAVPPSQATWSVICDGEKVQQTIRLRMMVKSYVGIEGKWVYRFSALPNTKVSIKHGKAEKTNRGNDWTASGSHEVSFGTEAGVEVEGEVGVPVFGPKAKTKISGKVSAGYKGAVSNGLKTMWNKESQLTEEKTMSFEMPEDKGSALWQWVLVAKSTFSGEEGIVQTQDYAFTMGGTDEDKPRCYPGGYATEGEHAKYAYKECKLGWYIED